VAKRRNLKKEKAERNRAYARQFRSQSTKGQGKRFGQRRQSSGSGAQGGNGAQAEG
jgi:hypothetical protein